MFQYKPSSSYSGLWLPLLANSSPDLQFKLMEWTLHNRSDHPWLPIVMGIAFKFFHVKYKACHHQVPNNLFSSVQNFPQLAPDFLCSSCANFWRSPIVLPLFKQFPLPGTPFMLTVICVVYFKTGFCGCPLPISYYVFLFSHPKASMIWSLPTSPL